MLTIFELYSVLTASDSLPLRQRSTNFFPTSNALLMFAPYAKNDLNNAMRCTCDLARFVSWGPLLLQRFSCRFSGRPGSSSSCVEEAGPSTPQSFNAQTTLLSGVTSINCTTLGHSAVGTLPTQ